MLKSSQLHGDLLPQQSFAAAVETYRRSLDLYRQVLALRVRREARLLEILTGLTPPTGRPVSMPPRPKLESLSPREREVANLIARGYSNQDIARTLVVTRGTVANHVAHILSKLGVTNRTQVAALVLQVKTLPQGVAAD